MNHPEEFTLTIMPDGRIVFDGAGMQETNYRRILDLLEDTVGPVAHEEGPPENPGRLYAQPAQGEQELEQRGGKG